MTKELLSQALEALEAGRPYVLERAGKLQDAAIASLRAALAEGEAEPVAVVATQKGGMHVIYGERHTITVDSKCVTLFSDLPVGTPLYTHPSPAALRAAVIEECEWAPDRDPDMGGTWHTNCGQLWSFIDGGPIENGMKFCHCCGKPLKEKA